LLVLKQTKDFPRLLKFACFLADAPRIRQRLANLAWILLVIKVKQQLQLILATFKASFKELIFNIKKEVDYA
jgi:hypothetical protein